MSSDATRLALYLQAEEEILLGGQSAAVPGRSLTKADLATIRKAIAELQARVNVRARGPIQMGRPN
jgi:hypothetical protein